MYYALDTKVLTSLYYTFKLKRSIGPHRHEHRAFSRNGNEISHNISGGQRESCISLADRYPLIKSRHHTTRHIRQHHHDTEFTLLHFRLALLPSERRTALLYKQRVFESIIPEYTIASHFSILCTQFSLLPISHSICSNITGLAWHGLLRHLARALIHFSHDHASSTA